MHNHGDSKHVIFNNPGKDFSDVSKITLKGSKTNCVAYCMNVIGLVFLSKSDESDDLVSLSEDQKAAKITSKCQHLLKTFPVVYNRLFNDCKPVCIVAHRNPKATSSEWQETFAHDMSTFLHEHESWDRV